MTLLDKLVFTFLDPGLNPGGSKSWSLEEGQTNVFLHTLPQLQPPEGVFPRRPGKVILLSVSFSQLPSGIGFAPCEV